MPKIPKSKTRIVSIILLVFFILIGIICYYYVIGFSSYKKATASEIHDDILQGLSGLGSVAIAVIIFRIQSLENRNHSLEQSTLNYISQTLGWSYPEWTSSVEEDIRNKTITNRYYAHLPLRTDEFIMAERDRQQKRLEEALNSSHQNTTNDTQNTERCLFMCNFLDNASPA